MYAARNRIDRVTAQVMNLSFYGDGPGHDPGAVPGGDDPRESSFTSYGLRGRNPPKREKTQQVHMRKKIGSVCPMLARAVRA